MGPRGPKEGAPLGPRVGQVQEQVVVHQAVVVEPPLEAVAVAGQQFEEVAAVLVVVEAGLAGLAAVEDVVAGGSGPLRAASGAGHDGTPRGFWVADPLLAPRRVAYPCRPLWQVAPPSRRAFLSQVLEKKRLG